MQRSMLISNSFGIFSAFGRSAGGPSGPGGTIRIALGGQTNSQSWQETHLVLPSWVTMYFAGSDTAEMEKGNASLPRCHGNLPGTGLLSFNQWDELPLSNCATSSMARLAGKSTSAWTGSALTKFIFM